MMSSWKWAYYFKFVHNLPTLYFQVCVLFPDAVKQIRQQELQEMNQRIQLFYQTAEQDIQKKQQELLTPVH